MSTEALDSVARQLVDDFLAELAEQNSAGLRPQLFATGKRILKSAPSVQAHVLMDILERRGPATGSYITEMGKRRVLGFDESRLMELKGQLLNSNLDLTAEQLERINPPLIHYYDYPCTQDIYLNQVDHFVRQGKQLPSTTRTKLESIQKYLSRQGNTEARKKYLAIARLLSPDSEETLPDTYADLWAQTAVHDLETLSQELQKAWRQLFFHTQDVEAAKPSPEWSDTAKALIAPLGNSFRELLPRWLSLVSVPTSLPESEAENIYGEGFAIREDTFRPVSDRNLSILKGLAWCCIGYTEPAIARSLEKMVTACLQKLPGIGPWAIRPATAAVYALCEMPENPESIPALARLKQKVIYRPVLAMIESGLEVAAKRQGVTKEDLEDLAVLAYGLDTNGKRREVFGDGEYIAEMALASNGDVTLSYFGPGGKPLKSAPARLKQTENAERFKELKADADAAQKTLTAQKTRFDSFYLSRRSWRYADFVERFIVHPLLSNLSCRLIWHFTDEDGHEGEGIYDIEAQNFTDRWGNTLDWLTPETRVTLWHPIHASIEAVQAWRERLAARNIQQPFKQAHREVYLLTDAEQQTNTYSNRFASHILKQHQMNSLAHQRGWKNPLRLMVDSSYPPATRDLPHWNLRAEFWVEGAGENYGTDTTESGSYLYLSTDQVRFYPLGAAPGYSHGYGGGYERNRFANAPLTDPLPLADIPALVFSEILREVDLFVGVASIGNDPSWQDGGADNTTGRYNNYWYDYSFGELEASAKIRAEVLEKLLPRLKIADCCQIEGRFLVVRGDLRTYKIHIGSANILMPPNDQYLCIVANRSLDIANGHNNGLFLPFEGDTRLSMILSKALLLAADTKITDETILRQIKQP